MSWSLVAARGAGPQPAHPATHPGYLGVTLLDLDSDTAARLHLRDSHGALIVTIDREAPAAEVGLRPRDVIIELNGQRIDTVDQLRRRLHDLGSGASVSLRVLRETGDQSQSLQIAVQLGDQDQIAARAWVQHFNPADPGAPTESAAAPPPVAEANLVPPRGKTRGSSFLSVFSPSASYTGADLDPLTTQLAEYFGVHDGAGLLVRTVNEGSPAGVAGLKAGDVILRVNNQLVVSREDWLKQLHANRGRPVQLAVMRNRHEQTMSMMAGSSKK